MFGSLAVLSVERDSPDGNIRTRGDAVWWSFTTMTTVGYGDHAPTTGLGRMIAAGLMLSGIALLGVTANIAAWFIARFEKDDVEERRQTEAIAALAKDVRLLRAEVARLADEREQQRSWRVPGAAVEQGRVLTGTGKVPLRRSRHFPKGRGELRDQPPPTRTRTTTRPPNPVAARPERRRRRRAPPPPRRAPTARVLPCPAEDLTHCDLRRAPGASDL